MKAARGFTLLEMVIVIGIFGLMSVMAYGGLTNVFDARRGIESALNDLADIQRAYWRLREDFQQIAPRPADDEFGQPQPAVLAPFAEKVTVSRSGWRNVLFNPRPGIERVQYRFEDEQLIRTSWPMLDLPPNADAYDVVLLDDVREVSWRFLNPAREWADSWPDGGAQVTPQLPPPIAIEITLDTRQWGEIVWLFRTGVGS